MSRVALATLAAAALTVLAGPALIRLLAPAIGAIADLALQSLSPVVRVTGAGLAARIEAEATLVAALPLAADLYVPALTRVGPASFSMAHALVPLTILLAMLAAWPAAGAREALWRAALGVPAALLLVAGLCALHLAGLLDTVIVDARPGAAAAELPLTVRALLFMESGGRWLAPLVTGVACIALARRAAARRVPRPRPVSLDAQLVALAARARRARDAGA